MHALFDVVVACALMFRPDLANEQVRDCLSACSKDVMTFPGEHSIVREVA
jgi:hypothetical protein